ncbi:MAG: hypothetical protein JNM91_08225, partial [Flavobacteriales bacterium]|nr:hypothetical protein [Flavobacteriales bacterium]
MKRFSHIAAVVLLSAGWAGLVRAQEGQPIPVEEPAWTQVVQTVDGSPIALGDTIIVNWSPISGVLYSQAMLDMLALRKDRAWLKEVPDMDVRITLHVEAKKHEDYASFATSEQYDSLLVVVLEMGYRNGTALVPGLDPELDKASDSEMLTEDMHWMRGVIQRIELNTGSGYADASEVPGGLRLELEVQWERLAGLDMHAPLLTEIPPVGCLGLQAAPEGMEGEPIETHEQDISWGAVTGAVEYHFEW